MREESEYFLVLKHTHGAPVRSVKYPMRELVLSGNSEAICEVESGGVYELQSATIIPVEILFSISSDIPVISHVR